MSQTIANPSGLDSGSDDGSVLATVDAGPSEQLDSDTDTLPSPCTPGDSPHAGQVAKYSPGDSFDEHDRISMKRILPSRHLQFDKPDPARHIHIHPPFAPQISAIPDRFWDYVRSTHLNINDYNSLIPYFQGIWELQWEWVRAGRKGFITKVRLCPTALDHNANFAIQDLALMDLELYKTMQQVLDATWEWQLGSGTLSHWISFLRCMQ